MIRISTAEREALVNNDEVDIEVAVLAINGRGFKTQSMGALVQFADGVLSEETIFTMMRGLSIETLDRAGWILPRTPEEVQNFLSDSPEAAVSRFANGETEGFRLLDILVEDKRLYRVVAIPAAKVPGRHYLGTMVMEVLTELDGQHLSEPDITIMSYADRPRLN